MNSRNLFRWQVGFLLMVVGAVLGKIIPTGTGSPVGLPEVQAAAQKPNTKPPEPFTEPPDGQTFVGVKECAACHLDQYATWNKSKHPDAFKTLPAKYRADRKCLKCHATGHGEATGFVSEETTPALASVACEACHGPSSDHAAAAKKYGKRKLTPEEDVFVRSTIYKIQPQNVCAACHKAESHSKHPAYDK
jgi:hypothetical protein